jgi:hypothetical protein
MSAPRLLSAVFLMFVVGCSLVPSPTPVPSATPRPTAPHTPEPTPTPTPLPVVEFPLPVVTGLTNLRTDLTLDEVVAGLVSGSILRPCGVIIEAGGTVVGLDPGSAVESPGCVPADEIAATVAAAPVTMAFLPPGIVEPKAKVLVVDGADPFGGPTERARPYPVVGRASQLPVDWTAYDPADIRTVISLGDSCPDRGVAEVAITFGRGWDYVFGGGWARYQRIRRSTAGPGQVGYGALVVDAVAAPPAGALGALARDAEVTVDDFECPVVDSWRVNGGSVFSIDPRVLPHLRDDYGVDVATLAANHLADQGIAGLIETLDQFDAAGIPVTGLGADLDQALEPVLLDVRGVTLGFVGFNEVPGTPAAGPGQPGVPWLTQANVVAGVERARSQGADLVFCQPQWGLPEYRSGWTERQRQQETMLYAAGCDHVLGSGTHWAGPINLPVVDGRVRVTIGSHGNLLFGQNWSQQTQEGVIVELTLRGTELAQARLHPYIVLEQAVPALTDPRTDGSWVLNRVYDSSDLD